LASDGPGAIPSRAGRADLSAAPDCLGRTCWSATVPLAVANVVWPLVQPETAGYLDHQVQRGCRSETPGRSLPLARPTIARAAARPARGERGRPGLAAVTRLAAARAGTGNPPQRHHRRHRHRHPAGGRAAVIHHPAKVGPRSGASRADVLRRPGRPDLVAVVLRHAGIVPARSRLLGPGGGLLGRSWWLDGRQRFWCRWPSP
jgi:hypothetical protein